MCADGLAATFRGRSASSNCVGTACEFCRRLGGFNMVAAARVAVGSERSADSNREALATGVVESGGVVVGVGEHAIDAVKEIGRASCRERVC